MEKVAVVFTNDFGRYYIEEIVLVDSARYNAIKGEFSEVIDESDHWTRFRETQEELSNPTTKDNESFCVIQYLE